MKSIELLTSKKQLITINVEQIKYIKKKSETISTIHFDKEYLISVEKSYNELKEMVNKL